MFHRCRALGVTAALIAAAGAGVIFAAPAAAAPAFVITMSSASSMPSSPVAGLLSATGSVVVGSPLPSHAAVAPAIGDAAVPRIATEKPAQEHNRVAEKGGGAVTPLIMVAGLALLFAAIFLVIRSGSSQRGERKE